MRNPELPAQMSPCLRIFIASLLDESAATATQREFQNYEFQPALSSVSKRKEFREE